MNRRAIWIVSAVALVLVAGLAPRGTHLLSGSGVSAFSDTINPSRSHAIVTVDRLVIDGAGARETATVGTGGTLVLRAGYSVQSGSKVSPVVARVERRVGHGEWEDTGVEASADEGDPLSARTPPYSAKDATDEVQYRLATETSRSQPVTITVENQQDYSGIVREIYEYAAPYCPTVAVHRAELQGDEAGLFRTGSLLIEIDAKVGVTTNLDASTRRSIAVHECSHQLQWANYGGTSNGRKEMVAETARYFADGLERGEPLEHAADCGAMAVVPDGYLGYGGYCTADEVQRAQRLLQGERY